MFTMSLDEIHTELDKINVYLSKCLWMDFELCQMSFINIVISGKIDTSSNKYAIDIEFEQPHCISSPFTWKTDTSKPFIELASDSEIIEMNRKFQVEQGNYVFKIYMEDFEDSAIYIAAKKIRCKIIDASPFSED